MRGLIMIGLIVMVGIDTGNSKKCPEQKDLSVLNSVAFCNFYTNLYRAKAASKFCMDGSYTGDFYCGVGPCNIFGYNCDGGCRLPPAVPIVGFQNNDICGFALLNRDLITDDFNRCLNKQSFSDKCRFHIHRSD